ncbi:MAG TPA: polyphosphate kinase 2 family protein [Gemmatimonadales bacterium]|nr:polyphosphate kinase 2 family protein [Gemmatimonadales bacterium]
MKRKDVARAFRVKDGDGFRLSRTDPAETLGFKSKDEVAETVARGVERLSALQEKLYAQDRWAVLLVFQALDAAGKDSTIKHVMSGVNPQGCQVYSFKAPSNEDLEHDFFWRAARCLPERGRIGIFNRSYYEEVLVVRVHPEILAREKLPPAVVTKNIWRERFEDIVAFERHLARNGTLVLKFFLHVSPAEQRRRFLERLDKPAKNWKFSAADLAERQHWKAYMQAYEEMIQHTATPGAPWYVIPADHKWFTRLVVMEAIIAALDKLDLAFPTVPSGERKALQAARAELEREGNA